MATLETLQDLLVAELQDLYNAENQILKALPKMVKRASNEELRTAFEEHLQQTEEQVTRLEQAMQLMDVPVKGKNCAGMKGIIDEGKELMEEEDAGEDVMDAALIAAAQKVEHYEIASYGAVRSYAALLGLDDVQELLALTLQEEEETDRRLTEIAESVINAEAVEGDDEGEETAGMARRQQSAGEEGEMEEEEEAEGAGTARRQGNGGRGGRKGHRGGRDRNH